MKNTRFATQSLWGSVCWVTKPKQSALMEQAARIEWSSLSSHASLCHRPLYYPHIVQFIHLPGHWTFIPKQKHPLLSSAKELHFLLHRSMILHPSFYWFPDFTLILCVVPCLDTKQQRRYKNTSGFDPSTLAMHLSVKKKTHLRASERASNQGIPFPVPSCCREKFQVSHYYSLYKSQLLLWWHWQRPSFLFCLWLSWGEGLTGGVGVPFLLCSSANVRFFLLLKTCSVCCLLFSYGFCSRLLFLSPQHHTFIPPIHGDARMCCVSLTGHFLSLKYFL